MGHCLPCDLTYCETYIAVYTSCALTENVWVESVCATEMTWVRNKCGYCHICCLRLSLTIQKTAMTHSFIVSICFFISLRVVDMNGSLYVKTLNDLRPSQIPAVCLCFVKVLPSEITLFPILCNYKNTFGCHSLLYKSNAMQLHWEGLWTEFILQLLPCIEQGQLKPCDSQLVDTESTKQLVAEIRHWFDCT